MWLVCLLLAIRFASATSRLTQYREVDLGETVYKVDDATVSREDFGIAAAKAKLNVDMFSKPCARDPNTCNQDNYLIDVLLDPNGKPKLGLYAVFDGEGEGGGMLVQFFRLVLQDTFSDKLATTAPPIPSNEDDRHKFLTDVMKELFTIPQTMLQRAAKVRHRTITPKKGRYNFFLMKSLITFTGSTALR